MKRDFLFKAGLVFLLLVVAFLIFFTLKEPVDNKALSERLESEGISGSGSDAVGSGSGSSGDLGTGGGAGGSSGSSSSGAGSAGGEEGFVNETWCSMVRPGNLPNIGCYINHITGQEVSLNIKNQLGEDITVLVSLDACAPEEILGDIGNDQESDFVFSCDNAGLEIFNEEIFISYVLGNDTIETEGFVSGVVE